MIYYIPGCVLGIELLELVIWVLFSPARPNTVIAPQTLDDPQVQGTSALYPSALQ